MTQGLVRRTEKGAAFIQIRLNLFTLSVLSLADCQRYDQYGNVVLKNMGLEVYSHESGSPQTNFVYWSWNLTLNLRNRYALLMWIRTRCLSI